MTRNPLRLRTRHGALTGSACVCGFTANSATRPVVRSPFDLPASLRFTETGRRGYPYTATTTVRSKLFSDHTPMWVWSQSDMMAK